MKNLFLYFLLCSAFLLGSTQIASADYTVLDDVTEVVLVNNKTGVVIFSFEIPDKYITKNGTLTMPIEISLDSEKCTVFTTKSTDLNIVLPSNLLGNHLLQVQIGPFQISTEVEL